VLGFGDLREFLQARCDAGSSVPRIASELRVSDWQVQAALSRLAVRLGPRPQRLAAQRRRYTEERIAARVAALGFPDVRAYLADRVVERAWLLAEVAVELGAHRVTVRRLLDRHSIRRVRRTPAERAAAEAGRRVQAVGWQAQRAARLAGLGFADLAGYLKVRYVDQGWSVKRMRAELGVGRRWLVGSWPGWGCDPDHRMQWRGCWAGVGTRPCCRKDLHSAFSPWRRGCKSLAGHPGVSAECRGVGFTGLVIPRPRTRMPPHCATRPAHPSPRPADELT
jgi:hypothetical protein